jgi:hypothetical protein
MKRAILSLTVVGLTGFALVAGDLNAQTVTVEMGPAAAMPTTELAGTNLDGGAGFGGTVALRVLPHVHLYGGWNWLRFTANQSFVGVDRDFEETGYTFGLRFEHPFGEAREELFRVEGGGTYKHVEIENDAGEVLENSGHSLGFEVGAGVVVPLGGAWRISPMLRYRSLSPDFELNGSTVRGDLSYGSVEVGVSRQF